MDCDFEKSYKRQVSQIENRKVIINAYTKF